MATVRVYLRGLRQAAEFHPVPEPPAGDGLETMLGLALARLLAGLPGYDHRTGQVDPLVPVEIREGIIAAWLERRIALCPDMRREWESLAAVASGLACAGIPGMIVAPVAAPEQGETGVISRQGTITLVAA